METHTFNITISGIVDDAHLNALIDAINDIAYVSDIAKISTQQERV